MGDALRQRRHGTRRGPGRSWYVDETYLKAQGRLGLPVRAIDGDGNLIDMMLSETRDMKAAQRFFRSGRSWLHAEPSDDGQTRLLSTGDLLDAGSKGSATDECLFE